MKTYKDIKIVSVSDIGFWSFETNKQTKKIVSGKKHVKIKIVGLDYVQSFPRLHHYNILLSTVSIFKTFQVKVYHVYHGKIKYECHSEYQLIDD